MTSSKSLCLIPWLHRFTNEQGFHNVCCSGAGPSNDLHDAHGKLLHIRQGLSDAELLNSPDMKAIRAGMLQGEWPQACDRCRRSEEAGAVSVRQHMNNRLAHWSDEAMAQTAADGTLAHPQVRYADIRLGNTCNLTCRMCNAGASRLWAQHFNQVQPKSHQLPVAQLTALRDSNWVKSQPVRQLIEECLPSVELLHFAGGEPLMIPEMLEALELCIASGRAGEIDLSYNTNITVLPDKLARLWPHFRNVFLLCSVDGFGPVNDYIRRPSRWKDIDRNLHLLDRNFEEWKLRHIVLSTTVQAYNVLQLDELYSYAATRFEHLTPAPQLAPLYTPDYLSIQILPARVKDVARERLLAQRAKLTALLPDKWQFIVNTIDVTIAYMDEAYMDEAYMDQAAAPRQKLMDFLYFSEKSDREFGDSWRTACPELARLLLPNSVTPPKGVEQLAGSGQARP